MINCGPKDHVASITKLLAERRLLNKQLQTLQQEAAASLGKALAAEATQQVRCTSWCQLKLV